jgi:two-component system, OmpR family, alkaline phosphatase synthesis response regulator PhoP
MNLPVVPKHILIIDDDASIRLVLEATFESLTCWSVSEANSGCEGIRKAEAEQPDLILMDYTMPGMNGLECLKHLRSNSHTKDIPVLVLTAELSLSKFHQFQSVGTIGIISKPFDPFLLVPYIIQALDWEDTQ